MPRYRMFKNLGKCKLEMEKHTSPFTGPHSPLTYVRTSAPGSVDNQRLELALINIFGVVGAVGAALLIIMLARRQPKLNAGSDSEVE